MRKQRHVEAGRSLVGWALPKLRGRPLAKQVLDEHVVRARALLAWASATDSNQCVTPRLGRAVPERRLQQHHQEIKYLIQIEA